MRAKSKGATREQHDFDRNYLVGICQKWDVGKCQKIYVGKCPRKLMMLENLQIFKLKNDLEKNTMLENYQVSFCESWLRVCVLQRVRGKFKFFLPNSTLSRHHALARRSRTLSARLFGMVSNQEGARRSSCSRPEI